MDVSQREKGQGPEKEKELKVYTFTRFLNPHEDLPQDKEKVEKADSKPEKDNKIAYTFTVTLYKNEIALLAKKI